MRRGDMSMGVIIGAAIALLILVIISVLLLNAFGNVSEGTGCYGIEDAVCVPAGDSCGEYDAGGVQYVQSQRSCPTGDDKCCIPI